ncbi:hypothetical protein Tco_1469777, partial [Tanacetum coccineum]
AKFCSHLGKGTVLENKLLCCVPDTAYGPHPIRQARISLIMFEFSSCLLAASAINLVDRVHRNMYSKLLLKFFLLPFMDNLLYSVIAASPSEVSVLLVLEDVPLCHFWEYLSISWMAILASAAVLEGLLNVSTPYCVYGIRRIDGEQIRHLDCKTQYTVLSRRFDTSYLTGGYDVSGDQSEQNTIKKQLNVGI